MIKLIIDPDYREPDHIYLGIETECDEIFEFLDDDDDDADIGKYNVGMTKIIWTDNLELMYKDCSGSTIHCRYVVTREVTGNEAVRYKKFLMSFQFALAVVIYPGLSGIGYLYDLEKLRNYVYECQLEVFTDYYNYEQGFGFNSAKGNDWMDIGILSMCNRLKFPAVQVKVQVKETVKYRTPKSEITVAKIFEWIQILKYEGKMILQKDIAAEAKMSIRTVRNYWPLFRGYVAWHNYHLAI